MSLCLFFVKMFTLIPSVPPPHLFQVVFGNLSEGRHLNIAVRIMIIWTQDNYQFFFNFPIGIIINFPPIKSQTHNNSVVLLVTLSVGHKAINLFRFQLTQLLHNTQSMNWWIDKRSRNLERIDEGVHETVCCNKYLLTILFCWWLFLINQHCVQSKQIKVFSSCKCRSKTLGNCYLWDIEWNYIYFCYL